MHNVARKHLRASHGQKEGESDGSWINDEGAYWLSLRVHVGLHMWQHLTTNGCVWEYTHILHCWWKSTNPVFLIHFSENCLWCLITFLENQEAISGEDIHLKKIICVNILFHTFFTLSWWILWRREGRVGGRTIREMLCRSMKNCSGILPSQLTFWEADLISSESIWLELWEITLLKITLVTAVETLCSQRDLYVEFYVVYWLMYPLKNKSFFNTWARKVMFAETFLRDHGEQ